MPGTASALYISVHFQTVIAFIQERMIHRNMAVFTLEDEQVMDDFFLEEHVLSEGPKSSTAKTGQTRFRTLKSSEFCPSICLSISTIKSTDKIRQL